ncbi:peptide deformylase [Weissella sagaensis]|jgi:peptide deformylase|uniref:Peptide deformylase n=1 Tax=Weissella sagaensis TaxID=2559928 RepID=A0ABW1RVM7_9LACO|nr:peptide deformylase [Weissella sagaensis]KAA8433525.1 peptide deformylase [Weissella paramesenteroides]MBU7568733.1 peptide deformylase [Weissella hellenica]KAA8438656.1 peptide deformylase [Weissella paramesenteroides]QDJ58956.1 peptide deformylase [Weissella hellenica]UEG67100.1 peptide deformylase [Weissella hellenica]
MYLMNEIVRDGNKVLRERATKVEFPLSDEVKEVSKNMMEYLVVSQNEEENEKYGLRPGVGLAAPQVGVSQQFSSILIPSDDVEELQEKPENDDEYYFKGTIYNPVITRQSVKQAALSMGEGCLSVDNDLPGYVNRAYKITVKFQNEQGEQQELRLSGYPAIVFQHEIDHLHGSLYYDHINNKDPWHQTDNTRYLG